MLGEGVSDLQGELPGEEGSVDHGELSLVAVKVVLAPPQVPVHVDLPDLVELRILDSQGAGDPVEWPVDPDQDVTMRVHDGGGEGTVSSSKLPHDCLPQRRLLHRNGIRRLLLLLLLLLPTSAMYPTIWPSLL